MSIRLDALLSRLALGSRAQVGHIVRQGRVMVDGAVVRNPAAHIEDSQSVRIDNAPLDTRLTRHLMLNKPAGVLTAARDGKQETIMSLLPAVYASLGCMPVGRLDKDTVGLLLLTTDGQLAHRLLSPARHVYKQYEARLDEAVTQTDVEAFANGLALQDFTALPAALTPLPDYMARVSVREGKFHQVKRMFMARGKCVLALKRLSFGPLLLDESLAPGQYRELTEEEIAALYAQANTKEEMEGASNG